MMLSLVFLGFIAANGRMIVNDKVGGTVEVVIQGGAIHSVTETLWCC